MPKKIYEIAVADSETDPFKYNETVAPFVWGLMFETRQFYSFWDSSHPDICSLDLIEYIKDYAQEMEADTLIVYMHNGGKFDFMFLLDHFDPDLFIINGRIAKATILNGLVEFRDSWCILPVGLKNKMADYSIMSKDKRDKHEKEIIEYLKGDCLELLNLVEAFTTRFGYKLTLASTAINEIRKSGYIVPRTPERYDEQLRPFYFGGRTQCFKTGKFSGNFYYIDINSAYPYKMLEEHWSGNSFYKSKTLPATDKNGSWFAKIVANSRGCLPFKDMSEKPENRRLIFPNDEEYRVYHASGHEINAGLKSGRLDIAEVLEVYKPTETQNFKNFILPLAAEKEQHTINDNYIQRTLVKLLMNSGYGKFGQDGRKFVESLLLKYGEWPDDDYYSSENEKLENPWRWSDDTIDNRFSIFTRPNPATSFFNVGTAASITGAVRAMLFEALLQVDDPLYSDTDSIICRGTGNLKIGKKLGDWDIEAEARRVYIAQKKMYAMLLKDKTTKVASKGVRLSYNDIKLGVINGQNKIFKKDAPAISLKYGQRFLEREISFDNIDKNALPF